MENFTALLRNDDTICAVATPPGSGAIAVIRMSGKESLPVLFKLFRPLKKNLTHENIESHHQYFGKLYEGDNEIDEVLISFFKGPHSYTGEDSVEIYCHGSVYIQQKIIEVLINNGVRLAAAGDFTKRAFLNGKMDLSQAEAVADLIASQSKMAHKVALNQMKGIFSHKIAELREKLLKFASLIELELDFIEEDVEFADRQELFILINELKNEISTLLNSFKYGNVIKHGIPVAIIGKPNTGKSTLLNTLLNEERAIVSDIPGTTRDSIEDTIIIEGYTFRFIDTAGLRDSEDTIENIGIERTYEKIRQADIILYVCDISKINKSTVDEVIREFKTYIEDEDKTFIMVANKIDKLERIPPRLKEILELDTVFVSAKRKENIHYLAETLVEKVKEKHISNDIIVTNSRHYESLKAALDSIIQVERGLQESIPTDLVAIDLRQALHHLGSVTGEITTNDILGTIFEKFCIGK
jgi:tRNA modification GTPase